MKKWALRIFIDVIAVFAIFILLAWFRGYGYPDRLVAANLKPIAEECGMDDTDKLIIDSFLVDSDYYAENLNGSWRHVARRSYLGEMLCFPVVGCLTKPVYTPECYGNRRHR